MRGYTKEPIDAMLFSSDKLTAVSKSAAKYCHFALQYATAMTLKSWDVNPKCVIGSGAGAAVAACLSGALDLPNALALAFGKKKAKIAFNKRLSCDVLSPDLSVTRSSTAFQRAFWDSLAGQKINRSALNNAASAGRSYDYAVDFQSCPKAVSNEHAAIMPFLPAMDSVTHLVAHLYQVGVTPDFVAFDTPFKCRFVDVPLYPLRPVRHWIENVSPKQQHKARKEQVAKPSKPIVMTNEALKLEAEISVLPPSQRLSPITAYLQELLGELMTVPSGPGLNDTTWNDLGFDSMRITEYTNIVGESLGLDLPATFLFDFTSLKSVAEYVASGLFGPLFVKKKANKNKSHTKSMVSNDSFRAAIVGVACRFPMG